MRTSLPHLLDEMGVEEHMESLIRLGGSISALMDATCDYFPFDDSTSHANRQRMHRLEQEHVVALADAELHLPESELAIYLHETVHFCDIVRRWNNSRNYWCFVTERFVGYIKGFVKNRSLPVANVVHNTFTVCMCAQHVAIS